MFELLTRNSVDEATGVTSNFPGLFVLFDLLTTMDWIMCYIFGYLFLRFITFFVFNGRLK